MPHTAEQEAEFKRLFAGRRRRQIILAVPFFLVIIALAVAGEGESQEFFGLPVAVWAPVLGVFVLGALIFSFRNWRCPACDKYLGKAMNPRFCSKCGVALR